ncbi:hypothetical protein RI129_003897 [Pyrocoelia pectoralis]|uniref:Uncharacterized protein n=1 Tax=Pyrocoelia pectoralis TaxID=417401 RepID=A0AAN7VJ79_9COLE
MLPVRPLVNVLPHVRKMASISGPPSVPVTRLELLCHGTVIVVSCLAIPTYVLTHIRKYRGLDD